MCIIIAVIINLIIINLFQFGLKYSTKWWITTTN